MVVALTGAGVLLLGAGVLLLGAGVWWLDDVAVDVRAGHGLARQVARVWTTPGAVPDVVLRFAAPTVVEVARADGCVWRSTVDPVTLAVAPVHLADPDRC